MSYLTYRTPSHWLCRHRLDSRIEAGEHTYFERDITFGLFEPTDKIEIGRYCSIARGAVLFGGGNHYVHRATTFPFQAFGIEVPGIAERGDVAPSPPTSIASDVWLGREARVMPGATIHPGVVVGAGALVSGTVPPYTVVGGNPATVLRHRFRPETVERLLEMKWWDWPTAKVLANVPLLMQSPDEWPDDLRIVEGPGEVTDFPAARTSLQVWTRHFVSRLRERALTARLLGR